MRIDRTDTFNADSLRRLSDLAERARGSDAAAPFSDDLWHAASAGTTRLALAAWQDGDLVGAAFTAPQGDRLAAELVVDPERRGRGHGGRLLAELLSNVDGELWLWSHGDHPAARELAERHHLERARELLQLRRPVGAGAPELPDIDVPAGIRIRTFAVGRDEPAWLDVNNAAFSWHPEQGGQTLEDIRAAEGKPDFDPAGFFLAVDDDANVLGFHWTKVRPGDPSAAPHAAAGPVGEIYVLGVAPAAHGRGLGAALTVTGLRHLADVVGVRTVLLYVEGDNTAAVRLYERLGFTRFATDVAYRRRWA